jgi:hypothetical protein
LRPRLARRPTQFPGAEGQHLAVLEQPQQRDLRRHRKLRYLVEEQRVALCISNQARAIFCTGECASPAAEQLVLDQHRRDRAAVHGDESAGAPRQRMDCLGSNLLAGAGIAAHEDRQLRARKLG